MVTTLSDLIDMIERSTVPLWLRDQILAKSDVIDQAMRNGGSITLHGPAGEENLNRAAHYLSPPARSAPARCALLPSPHPLPCTFPSYFHNYLSLLCFPPQILALP